VEWEHYFSDILWIEGRKIIRADRTERSLTDEQTIFIAVLAQDCGIWKGKEVLAQAIRVDRKGLARVWQELVCANVGTIHERVEGCTFQIAVDPSVANLGYRMTGYIRVLT
jgi:hypothetical protein